MPNEEPIRSQLSAAYFSYKIRHNKYPKTIWVTRYMYELYKAGLIANTRFTSEDVIPIERLMYRDTDVRPVDVIGMAILKTTRCTERYNG